MESLPSLSLLDISDYEYFIFFLPPPCKRVYRALFKPKIQHLYRNKCVYFVSRRFEIGEIWKIKNIVLVTLKFKLKEKIYYDF